METEHKLQVTIAEMKKDITFIKDALIDNTAQHKEIMSKIDHLADTFQGEIQEKADQREVMVMLDTADGRVSKLEVWQSYVIGFCACVALLLVPIIIAIVLDYVK